MKHQTATKNKTESITSSPLLRGILQRKCACGNQNVGNGECAECGKKKQLLQRRATHISEPGDRYEQEADRIADEVMRMPEPTAKHQVGSEKDGVLQRKAIANTITPLQSSSTGQDQLSGVPPIVNEVLRSPGHPLDSATQISMESRFGNDFSQVRVHTDSKAAESARAVSALAYTVGQNVVFGSGQYTSGTKTRQRLLAHELVHTIQQTNGTERMNQLHIQRYPQLGCAYEKFQNEITGVGSKPQYLKVEPRSNADNFPGDPIVDGDVVVVKNSGRAATYNNVNNCTWGWVEIPGKKSPDKSYPVLHGFIDVQHLKSKEAKTKSEESKKEEPKQENQGVSEHVLEVAGNVLSPERYEQLRCVIIKTACGSRPGGIPEPSDFDSANNECRKEKGYTGTENLYPTYDECREFGTASPLAPARLEQAQKLIVEYQGLAQAGLLTQDQMYGLEAAITRAKESVENLVPKSSASALVPKSSAPAPIQDNKRESLSIAPPWSIPLTFRSVGLGGSAHRVRRGEYHRVRRGECRRSCRSNNCPGGGCYGYLYLSVS